MDARELDGKLCYLGMEKDARKILIDEKIKKPEEVAIMTSVEVCDELLKYYTVVSCEDEDITIVKNEDIETYNSIVKCLSR